MSRSCSRKKKREECRGSGRGERQAWRSHETFMDQLLCQVPVFCSFFPVLIFFFFFLCDEFVTLRISEITFSLSVCLTAVEPVGCLKVDWMILVEEHSGLRLLEINMES